VAFLLDGRPALKSPAAAEPEVVLDAPGGGDDPPAATGLEWVGGDALAVLTPEAEESSRYSLSISRDGGRPIRLAENVAGAAPGGGGVFAAVDTSSEDSPAFRLVFVGAGESSPQVLPGELPGRVTGLSVGPDGARAVLSVEREGVWEVWAYRFANGALRRLAVLREGVEILGDPQITARGAYFVAGESKDTAAADGPPPYALYQVRRDASREAPVEGVGETFSAAAIRVSPDGGSLAVLGRRGPGAPVELYVLDLATGDLRAATSNEDMEIRTNPGDLAWTPTGRAVLLVARGSLSGPETYDGPASDVRTAFFNLYEVPVRGAGRDP
jgi:hypothetical protein